MLMEKPWLKSYPSNIPTSVNVNEYDSVISLFDEVLTKYKSQPAFTCLGKTLTFGELDKQSRNFAAFLHSQGLQPGDRIALMMPNLLQYPIALFGTLRAGLVVVNTNPLYTPREMLHQFNDSGAKAVLIAENFASNLQSILGKTAIETVVVTSIGEMLSFPKKMLTNFVIRKVKKMVPQYDIPHAISFSSALKQGSRSSIKPFTQRPEDTVLLQYTGGTTGVAKGAMLTNASLVANMIQLRATMMPYLEERTEVALSPLPLYHIFAFAINCLAFASIGSHTVLVVNPRDLPSLMKEFKNHKITIATGVNTLFNSLLNHPDFSKLDFSHLKICVAGGMAVQLAVAKKWHEVTGCPLTEGLGMTECSPVVSANPMDGTGKIGTVGLPLPSTDMRIVDEDLNPLPMGEVGEIQVRGPQVMKGYYNRPEATAKSIVDGWLCTGDIGMMDEDGYFKIVDRKKDMILVSGFNVYPNEIEEVVVALEKVLEVAAVAYPDEKSTEVVKVFVVKKDGSLTKEEIFECCKKGLTGYKRPKHIEFREELPKSPVGKILRRMLRDEVEKV